MGKVLVVEDNDLLRENICEVLELDGLEVVPAINGEDGWNKVIESQPDLVLSDVNMPIMDGFELLKSIREHEQLRSLPFIFLTVRNTMKELRLGMNYGADDYLAKPFEINQLLTVVQNRLKRTSNSIDSILSPEIRKSLSLVKAYDLAMNKEVFEPLDQVIENTEDEEDKKLVQALKSNVFKIISSLKVDKLLKGLRLGKKYQELEEEIEISSYIKEFVQSTHSSNPIGFDISLEPFFYQTLGDYFKIVVKEVIENAFKFSNGSSPVIINGSMTTDGRYKLSIVNKGLDLPSEVKAQIGAFKTFVRDHSYNPGMGLGLYNSVRILEALKIEYSISSVGSSEVEFIIYMEED